MKRKISPFALALGSVLAVLLSTMITLTFLVHMYSTDLWRGGALIASTLGTYAVMPLEVNGMWEGKALIAYILHGLGLMPFDIIRILGLLMAMHYARYLPKILRNTHAKIKNSKGFPKKCSAGLGGVAEIAVSVAVPILFYAVFGGGGHELSKIAALGTIGA